MLAFGILISASCLISLWAGMLPHTHAHTHIYKQVFSAGSVVRSGSRTMQKCAHLHTSAYNLPALVVLGYWLKVKSGVSGGVVVKDMGHV